MGMFNRRRSEPEVIDLRTPKPAAPEPQWGSPVACPSCGGRGYLEHIDPFREIMFLHCTLCYEKYEVSRAELRADQSTFTI